MSGLRSKQRKKFRGSEKTWNKILKRAPCFFFAAVASKTRSPEFAQTPTKNLKSTSIGKILTFTDEHGSGL